MPYDPRGDPSNLMGYDPNYKPVTGTGGDPRVAGTAASQAEHEAAAKQSMAEDAAIWGSGYSTRKSAQDINKEQTQAQRDVAKTRADADIEVARIRAAGAGGMAKGGPVKDPRASRRMYAKGGPIFR